MSDKTTLVAEYLVRKIRQNHESDSKEGIADQERSLTSLSLSLAFPIGLPTEIF